jgi:hypothetical protein
LGDGGGFLILYRLRETDEETTGTSTAIEGDEQEDGPGGEDLGEQGDLLGDSRASRQWKIDSKASNIFVSWAVLSRARTAAALVSAMSTRVDVGTMAADRQGWRTRPLGAGPCCFSWEGRRHSEGGHLAFLAHENVATLAFFTNEERSESRD